MKMGDIGICQNCQKEGELAQVFGYWVCPDCEVKAQLPWHMRGDA